jgi:hypothetical protein
MISMIWAGIEKIGLGPKVTHRDQWHFALTGCGGVTDAGVGKADLSNGRGMGFDNPLVWSGHEATLAFYAIGR